MFKDAAGPFDICVTLDGKNTKQVETMWSKEFPISESRWKLMDDVMVVYCEEDARARRQQITSRSLRLRETIFRAGMSQLPDEPQTRRHLPDSGTTATDVYSSVPMIPIQELPRTAF